MNQRNSRLNVVLALLVLYAVLGAAPALAQNNGCMPIAGAGPGTVFIGNPGCYFLTEDLEAGQPLRIQLTSFPRRTIDIDLAGHTITANQFSAIFIDGVNPVSIRNGTLIGGTSGLAATDSRRVTLRDL